MTVETHEIADRIYRFSTFVPEVAAPAGFTFNQFLIDADEPLLFHCGGRAMFSDVAEAVARVIPLSRLRWISFGHVESDECGSMNRWLAAAPGATVAHGQTGCMVSLNDLADRPPKVLADGEALDLGGAAIVWHDTPHTPHGWEAGVVHETRTNTLFCGDLLTHAGAAAPLTETDVLGAAISTEEMFRSMALGPGTAPAIRSLAALAPARLAIMHGASYAGDGAAMLNGLADWCEARIRLPV